MGAIALIRSHAKSLVLLVITVALLGDLAAERNHLPERAPAVLLWLMIAWRIRWPSGFHRIAGLTWRSVWRRILVYRLGWKSAMLSTGLAWRSGDKEFFASISGVRSNDCVDRVTIRMLPGQLIDDWGAAAPRLAQTFGLLDARVRSVPGYPQKVVLLFQVRDPLIDPVSPIAAPDEVDLAALSVGRGEDGDAYRLRLLGTHVLVVGATGAGKGSVLWSTLAALGPAIRDGLAQIWAIDPKGGMELAPGWPMFTRFAYGESSDAEFETDFADILEAAVAAMRRRQSLLRGRTRLHTPTVQEPFIVLMIDELASLTAYVSDRDAKKRIATALSLLLSQGRAVGVTVIAALQDPRKEALPFRDLFPTRIALRLAEAEQVRLVLGAGAYDRGAHCERISESLPGVGYVSLDGVAEPVRVRFSHITDADITELAEIYSPVTHQIPTEGTGPELAV